MTDQPTACQCGRMHDVRPVQFRDGWGKSANGFHATIHYLCAWCRKANHGTWRHYTAKAMTDQQDITQEELSVVWLGETYAGYCSICGQRAWSGMATKSGPDGCVEAIQRGYIFCDDHFQPFGDLIRENKRLHAELLEIHTIAQCVAECHEVQEGDSLTVKAVKGMAHHIKMLEQKMHIKDKQMDNLRIMEEQLLDKVERIRLAELNTMCSLFENWWLDHHDDSAYFNEVMKQCPTAVDRMQSLCKQVLEERK